MDLTITTMLIGTVLLGWGMIWLIIGISDRWIQRWYSRANNEVTD